jgi:hypothetical protein
MAAEIRQLKRGESTNCIRLLEFYLEEAKAGNLIQCAVVGCFRDGTDQRIAADTYSGSRVELLGGTVLLQNMISDMLRENARPIGSDGTPG